LAAGLTSDALSDPRLTARTAQRKVASSHRSDWLQIRRKEGHRALSEIIIHDDENFERALRRFKKKCEKAGILSDLRKHRHYEKPSERRKRKMNAAIRKNRRTRTA
jgi:small subunit ribosomal protein S21